MVKMHCDTSDLVEQPLKICNLGLALESAEENGKRESVLPGLRSTMPSLSFVSKILAEQAFHVSNGSPKFCSDSETLQNPLPMPSHPPEFRGRSTCGCQERNTLSRRLRLGLKRRAQLLGACKLLEGGPKHDGDAHQPSLG